MNGKILAGLFVIVAMAGIGFAWYGFNGEHAAPADADREAMDGMMNEKMEECRVYFESDEATALREEMHSAMEAGDEDKIAELREQMQENAPEGCMPPMHGKMFGKRIMGSLPEDVQEEFKAAMENKDFEALKALKEEYFPGNLSGGMKGPFGGCKCSCETTE